MRWTIDPDAAESLQSQISACVRHAVASGELAAGDRLPPAAELAPALDVDRNTVLAAFRALRDEGLLEFRRGRGTRVAAGVTPGAAAVSDAARQLVELGRAHQYSRADLIHLIKELP